MKILLISPKCSDRPPEVYNVGLAYIGAALKADGHEVELLDLNTKTMTPDEMVSAIKGRPRPDVVAMGTLVTVFNHVSWLIGKIKEIYPDMPVWVGNSVASTIPEIFMQNTKADLVVVGEGELTVRELASGRPLEEINGLYYRKGGEIAKTPPRQAIPDLDTLPLPAYELFEQEIYMTSRPSPIGKRVFTLGASSRGCPYHCTYCYHAFQGMRPRYHSPERMISELEYAMGRYDFDAFSYADDLFIANRKRVFEFCDLLEKAKIKKKWGCAARVNLVDEELLRKMRSAGCVWVSFGVESGSQKMLNNIKKGVTVEQARRAIDITRKAGIRADISLMIGNVGEDRETAMETVRFTEDTDTFCPALFIATPYPQTELYEYGLKTGKIKDEFSLIKSYGEQATTLLVNFSELSDEGLLSLKAEAESMIKTAYLRRHPLKFIAMPLSEFAFYLKSYGLTITLLRAIQKIIRLASGNPKFKLPFLERLAKGKRMFQ